MKLRKIILLIFFSVYMLHPLARAGDVEHSTSLKIGLTHVFVNDVDEAYTFYTQVLGFVKIMVMPEYSIAIVASPLAPDGVQLLLEPIGTPLARNFQKGVYQAGLPAIVFYTDDIYKEYERLVEAGVKFIKKPEKTEWGIEALFDDTCGNLIQIFQNIEE